MKNKKIERVLCWLAEHYPEYWYETITHQPVNKPYYSLSNLFSWLKGCRNINGWVFKYE